MGALASLPFVVPVFAGGSLGFLSVAESSPALAVAALLAAGRGGGKREDILTQRRRKMRDFVCHDCLLTTLTNGLPLEPDR